MLGELCPVCLDNYIQVSTKQPPSDDRMLELFGIFAGHSAIQLPHSLDLSPCYVHNYKAGPKCSPTKPQSGNRLTPTCAPPAGPGSSGRIPPASRGSGGPALPRQRILRPERPGPGQVAQRATRCHPRVLRPQCGRVSANQQRAFCSRGSKLSLQSNIDLGRAYCRE